MRQASYRYLDPKFETFSRLFSKTIFLFQTQGYQIVHQYRLQKRQEQSFFHDALQTYGRNWIRFDENEKKSIRKHLLLLWKKTQDFLPFFQDFISGKLRGKFQDLPRTKTSLCRAQRKARRRQRAVCTLPMVPCGSSPVGRLYLRKTKRLRRRLLQDFFKNSRQANHN